jgi:hypothetical protein
MEEMREASVTDFIHALQQHSAFETQRTSRSALCRFSCFLAKISIVLHKPATIYKKWGYKIHVA